MACCAAPVEDGEARGRCVIKQKWLLNQLNHDHLCLITKFGGRTLALLASRDDG